jgi:Arc/MetJ-type ribon-helix-helix transcriptional regulator
MIVELKPEVEALIQKRIQSGAYSSPEEVIERALEFQFKESGRTNADRHEPLSAYQEGEGRLPLDLVLHCH